MTNFKNLAEKIAVASRQDRFASAVAFRDYIEAEISSALEELKEDRDRWADSAIRLEQSQKKIKKEAYEQAQKDIAERQAMIHGESVMLGGRVITNEELYKQPTDYIKEAKREAIIELCEGDDCFVARKEQEAYEKGFKAGHNCDKTKEQIYREAMLDAAKKVCEDCRRKLDEHTR